ncbi:MAG: hypothetical protein HYS98_05915 [Deltaproteobacteria bacterium]|nr:hypothetical protein [Deltaproteobacteria bacterium]
MFHSIQVRGAAQNNLKNINVDIPHLETIYAEGKRKFIESLSTYTRLYMERIQKPKVDSIENLSPTIAIEQRNAVRNSRSTVATTTEIYDYLRLLYARIGILHCPKCEMPVKRETVHDVEQFLLDQLNQKEVFWPNSRRWLWACGKLPARLSTMRRNSTASALR